MNRRRLLPLLIIGCSFAVMLSAVACGSGLDDASDSTGSQTDGGGGEGGRRLGDGGMEEAGAGGNAQTPDGSGTVSAGSRIEMGTGLPTGKMVARTTPRNRRRESAAVAFRMHRCAGN